MKRILLIIAAVAMLAAPVNAQLISLWADEGMTECDVKGVVMAGEFDFYVFVEPDVRGIFGTEFKLVQPHTGIFVVGVPYDNPAADIKVAGGSWFGDGMALGFGHCHEATFWITRFTMVAYDVTPGWYTIIPVSGPVQQATINVAICDEPHTKLEGFAYNELGFNDDCRVGTEESSWGAIKSLME